MKKLIFFLIIIFLSNSAAQVQLYRQLPVFDLSAKYRVEIKTHGTEYQEIFIYQMDPGNPSVKTKMEHFGSFAFDAEVSPVDVRISMIDGTPLSESNIELVNKTYTDVAHSFENNTMIITCEGEKKHLLVRQKDDHSNPLMIFADPLKESSIPDGANVYRFEAGSEPYIIEAEYDRFTIPSDVDIVYIEDGAVVQGTIHTTGRSKPVKVMGRGVVLGNGPVVHGISGIPYNAVYITDGPNNVIEGITVIKSRHFSVDIGKGGIIDNVKMFGYDTNNDGIVAGDNSTIRNTFFKVNDDHVKVYNNNLRVHDCTFYVQYNGGIFQYCWGGQGPTVNALVENCEILEIEYTWCGDPALNQGGTARSFINLKTNNNVNTFFNANVFRNIKIQGRLKRFISINGKYDAQPLSFEAQLDNIEIDNTPDLESLLYTDENNNIDILMNNVTANDICIDGSTFKTEGNINFSSVCGEIIIDTPKVKIELPDTSKSYSTGSKIKVKARVLSSNEIFKLDISAFFNSLNARYQEPYEWELSYPIPGKYSVVVNAIDIYGNVGSDSISISVVSGTTSVENNEIQNVFTLMPNYPNPFNPSTNISFNLPKKDHVKMVVYDSNGNEVQTLVDNQLNQGKHSYKFNIDKLNRKLSSGVYYYTLKTSQFSKTNKMMILK